MATEHLADWATTITFEDLPEDVLQAATRSFYNYVGCTIGGSDHEAAVIARNALAPFFGPPQASLLGTSITTDAQHAALLNGIASHVHDYDDTHLDTIIHPTGPIASALLAVAELQGPGRVSGADFLLALIIGIEATCKVGLAVWPEHYDVGWHITSTAGAIGAAVGVAKLFALSSAQTCHAIGLAATQVVGLRDMFGSHTKSFHVGRAAQAGLMAVLLAQQGFTSSTTALEAKRGWASVVASTKPDPQAGLQRWLGLCEDDDGVGLFDVQSGRGRWEILRNSFKPFPCGIVIHPVIDACIQLHDDISTRELSVADVTSVEAKVHPLVLELTGKKTPQDGLQAKFSVYHSGACGLVLGRATPSEYKDAIVHDDTIVGIRDSMTAEVEEDLNADEAKVAVVFKDGSRLHKHVLHAVGSSEAPMSDTQLEQKFLESCHSVLGIDKAREASKAIWDIGSVEDVTMLAKMVSTR